MEARFVHQTRLVLIACLIAFGLPGISYAQKNGHPPWVWSVAYSPDGSMLASGSTDETIRLWDVATGSLLATLSGHTKAVTSVAYAPAGGTLASGGYDNNEVRFWDLASYTGGEPTAVAETSWGRIKALLSVP